jgi:hypothetical protein
MDSPRPALTVWAERAAGPLVERRKLFQKVEVVTRYRLHVEPRFFLWPLNVIRTPAGLIGCGSLGIALGAHWAAGALATGLTFAIGVPTAAVLSMAGMGTNDQLDALRVVFFCSAALLETPLLLIDLPNAAVFGTSLYPVARVPFGIGEHLPEYTTAMRRPWHFAWDYQAYPTLPVVSGRVEERRVLPGEVIAGEWMSDGEGAAWQRERSARLWIEYGGHSEEMRTAGGESVVDLQALRTQAPAGGTLSFTIRAEASGKSVCGRFTYPADGVGGGQMHQ